ncbi:TIGR02302 family protein [Oricola thermophila]|uniref:TIGR02302 family protein n=1 Tax=Oricola thermophila TaxID=2742145 RepID=A0A6N1VI60_9HYPH|nr:TIGR02302 family protein [Oricola thermophila]QKV20123.1 TIGR02302 family protein [Oricola thermophila]
MAVENQHTADPRALSRRLRYARAATYAAILSERLLPRLLPLLLVLALFAILSWFGLFRVVGDAVRIVLVVLFGLVALASLWPLRGLRLPEAHDVDRRLERENALSHAPITTQEDRLAAGADDGFAAALWRAHQRRMAERVDGVHGAQAKTGIPARDPHAMRAAVALVAVIAFAWSHGTAGGRLTDAFHSHHVAETVPVRIDAWITPPAYTGMAPIFLTSEQNAERGDFTVPEGSVAVVRIAGGSGSESVTWPEPQAALGIADEDGNAQTAASRRYEVTLEGSGRLSVFAGPEETLRDWSLSVMPDAAPTIAWLAEPVRAANGAMTLQYRTLDDYRVARARGIIALAETREDDARPLYDAPELPLSLPRRSSRDGAAKTVRDLAEHPWAGARVTVILEAEDDRGQIGRSEAKTFVLPGRPFANPLARAIIEQRRNLALDADAVPDIVDVLDVFTLYPEETIDNAGHFLGLVTTRSRLIEAEGDEEALRDVVDQMWELARGIEDGNLSEAEKRLQAAQQALKEALENGASDEEIEQLMAELREAMQEYLSEMARQMQNNPDLAEQLPSDNMQEMDMQSLQEMLDKIEELAKSGAREQAQELLSQLQDMMNNLQMGQHRMQQGDRQSQAQQQMNELGEILRQQQELMNETYRQNRRGGEQQGNQPGEQQGEGQQGQQGEPGQQGQMGENGTGNGLEGLAPGQQALRDRLEQFMDGLRGMGINPGEEFGEAGRAMGDAGQALQQGEGEQAFSEQGRAMDALRRGADSMMQQMQQAMDGGTGASEPGGNRNALDRDPLGRPQRSAGPDFGETVEIPDEIDVRRAREILEAIRRRLGNALSPQLEKEYLERLLDLN